MSLVAYGSSDEESDGSSASEEVQNSDVSKEIITSKLNSLEDALTKGGTEPVKEKGLILPSPKQSSEISNSAGRKASLSSFLPKPKNVNNLERESKSGQGESYNEKPPVSLETMADDDDEILEIEDEYEPIAKRTKNMASSQVGDKPRSVGSLFSLLPAPWQAENTLKKGSELRKKANSKQIVAEEKRSKQPIKIAIPTAPKTDSDEENDMPATKKLRPSKGGSGLKSLLPKPKHSITLKADNPNKPTVKLASRPLIPHTLTKKVTAVEKKPQTTAKKNQAEDAISDDEDEPVSFFTFSDKTESATGENTETFLRYDNKISAGVKLHEPSLESTNPSVPSFPTATSQSSEKHLMEIAPLPVMEEPSTGQADSVSEEKLNTGELYTRTYHYEQQQPEQMQQYGGYSANDYENYSHDPSSSSVSQPYYSQEPETYTYTYPTGTATQAQNQPQQTDIDLEKLQKLKGRRNRHEEINIVDVNADDQIGNSAEMVAKYGTEEIAHRPSRKKKDMPTAQQRRKHQISYLAFQAKEREFELRQQWSANRQTRRQTQSKYGF